MKKTLLMLLAVMFSVAMLADDIIITKDSQRINAKIEEVGVDAVKYRRTDNLTGPLYSISKAEIASIIYENGTVEAFQAQAPVETPKVSNTANIPMTDKDYLTLNGVWVGKRDGSTMSPKEYMAHLQTNCPQAYSLYQAGYRLEKTGDGFMLGSVILGVPGVILLATGLAIPSYPMTAAGSALLAAGGSCALALIPFYCVGRAKMRASVDMYNMQCAPPLTLSVTAGQNGIGLALNF